MIFFLASFILRISAKLRGLLFLWCSFFDFDWCP